MKQLRLLIAEILMKWALLIMPDGKEKIAYSVLLISYAEKVFKSEHP